MWVLFLRKALALPYWGNHSSAVYMLSVIIWNVNVVDVSLCRQRTMQVWEITDSWRDEIAVFVSRNTAPTTTQGLWWHWHPCKIAVLCACYFVLGFTGHFYVVDDCTCGPFRGLLWRHVCLYYNRVRKQCVCKSSRDLLFAVWRQLILLIEKVFLTT